MAKKAWVELTAVPMRTIRAVTSFILILVEWFSYGVLYHRSCAKLCPEQKRLPRSVRADGDHCKDNQDVLPLQELRQSRYWESKNL